MLSEALQETGWIEDEEFLAEHWEEMTITDPEIPVGGVWKDGLYICLFSDRSPSARHI